MIDSKLKVNAYMRIRKKRVKYISGVLNGTVYSGHPLRTTFGNSMRMYYYNKYMFHLAKVTVGTIFVCGDDSLVLLQRQDIAKVQEAYWRINSDVDQPNHGLG